MESIQCITDTYYKHKNVHSIRFTLNVIVNHLELELEQEHISKILANDKYSQQFYENDIIYYTVCFVFGPLL